MTQDLPTIDYLLSQIEEISFGLQIPEGFKIPVSFQFHVSLEATINAELKQANVVNKIEIRSEVKGPSLAYLTVRYSFDFIGFDLLETDKSGTPIIPRAIQIGMNAIALSTTRGIMFSKFKGTAVQNAILPLIDAANFSSKEHEILK